MMLLIFFQFISFVLSGSPYVYGGGCAIIKNTLYYVGGVTDNLGRSPIKQNFMLDLSASFFIDQYGEAPWKPVIASGNDISFANFPSVVAQGNSDNVFMFGGEEANSNRALQVLDVGDKSWSNGTDASLGWTQTAKRNLLPTKIPLSKATLVQSDINPDEYFVFGGRFYAGSESNATYLTQVYKFVQTSGNWTLFADFKRKIQGQTAVVYNGKLFVIGGSDPENGFKSYPMDEIHYLDLRTGLTGVVSTKGDVPSGRVGQSTVLVGSKVYSVGGTNEAYLSSFFLGLIIVLDLSDFTWSTIDVSGFVGNYAGCLASYDGVLIHSFGFQGMAMSNTQLIDLKTNLVINSLNKSVDTAQASSHLGIILASIFGGLLLILLLFILGYSIWKRFFNSNREPKIPPPEIIQANIWTDDLRPTFNNQILSQHSDAPEFQ